MSASRVELLLTELRTAIAAITQADGYRSTLKHVLNVMPDAEQLLDFPSAAIIAGEETLTPKDQSFTCFDSLIEVTVFGYLKGESSAEEGEALLHDFKRALATIFTSHATDAEAPWIVAPERITVTANRYFDTGKRISVVSLRFGALLLNQDSQF